MAYNHTSPRRQSHRKISYLLGGGCGDGSSEGHQLGVNSLAANPHHGTLLSAGRDATIRIWESDKCVGTLHSHADTVNDVTFVTGGNSTRNFASCSSDHVTLLHLKNDTLETALHKDAVKKVRQSGHHLFTVGLDGVIICMDIARELQCVNSFKTPLPLTALGAHAAGESNLIIAGNVEGDLHLVDYRAPSEQGMMHKKAHSSTVKEALFTGQTTILTAGSDGVVRLWDSRNTRYSFHTVCHTDAVFSLAMVNSTTFLSSSRDGTVAATNVASLETSTIIVERNPIHGMALTSAGTLYTCSSLSPINSYSLHSVLSREMMMKTGQAATLDESVSPSRVEIFCGDDDDSPKVDRLVPTEPRKYTSLLVQEVPFENKEQRAAWSTSKFYNRPKRQTTKPLKVLPHRKGAIVQCEILSDKRHVLTQDDEGRFSVWSLLRREKVRTLDEPCDAPFADVMKKVCIKGFTPGWCVVDCRWGSVCVTLKYEETYNAMVNRWDLDNNVPFTKASPLSIYMLSPSQRLALRGAAPVNLGANALLSLFNKAKDNEAIVIWNTPSHYRETNFTSCVRVRLLQHERMDGTSIPVWVQSALEGETGSPPAHALRPINVELHAMEGGHIPSLKRNVGRYEPHVCLADVAVDLLKELGMHTKLPERNDIIDQIVEGHSNGEDTPQKDKKKDGSSEKEGGEEHPDAKRCFIKDHKEPKLHPDEFVEFFTHDGEQVIDPLMALNTAAMLFKRKADRVDQLYVLYRRNRLIQTTSSK